MKVGDLVRVKVSTIATKEGDLVLVLGVRGSHYRVLHQKTGRIRYLRSEILEKVNESR